MTYIPIGKLVIDFDIYPRAEVDSQHVAYLAEALRAGNTLPALIVEKKTYRIADGVHRYRAHMQVFGADHEVEAIEKTYASDAELFLDAARYNSGHGRILTMFDRTHCLLKADQLKIEPDQIASALQITIEKLGELRTGRVGNLRHGGDVPLKRTIQHMAGQRLTKPQMEANRKLSGMNQMFYVNQLILLLENDLLDVENEKLLDALARLRALLTEQKMAA